MKKIIVYHHNDADGKSAAKVVEFANENAEVIFREINYGEENIEYSEIEQADEVFMVDFTSDNMREFAEKTGDKLVWIDHHKTAMERFTDLWDSSVKGLRRMDKAGCALTWEYCFPDEIEPNIISYLADWDIWKFEYENTKPFCVGFNTLINGMIDPLWIYLFNREKDSEIDCVSLGKILLRKQDEKVKGLFKTGKDIIFASHRARLVNSSSDGAVLGEYIYSQPDYELAVIWRAEGNKIIVGLYSNSVDCSILAKERGGGGHRGASGYRIENGLEKFYTEFFGGDQYV